MNKSRVWIYYEPRLYRDLFTRLFPCLGPIEVMAAGGPGAPSFSNDRLDDECMDVIVLSLDARGDPYLDLLPDPLPEAKLIAFSPGGEVGMRRLPGESGWEEIRPFGLPQLVREVLER